MDPIEKKPFYHVLPGAKALSFGMLGCDFHCGYCFPGDTIVATVAGPATLADLHEACSRKEARPDAHLGFPEDLQVVAGSGTPRRVRGIVRHEYEGDLVRVQAYYLPSIRCTPDHRVYATRSPGEAPSHVLARDLTVGHYLAVPRRVAAGDESTLDAARVLAAHRFTRRILWDLPAEQREFVAIASASGETSRSIGATLGKSASYVRHVRSRIARGRGSTWRTHGLVVEDAAVRFVGEHAPGIPASIAVGAELGALLGYYCAEGCVVKSARRPNSYVLSFSFGPRETALAERVQALLRTCLGLEAQLVERDTTIGVAVSKSSAALLFKALAGGRSSEKRVPSAIAAAPPDVVSAFLEAYVAGDGHRYPNGKVSATTVSRPLAYGIAWLVLRAGHPPSIYANEVGPVGVVQGRWVSRAPVQYTVVWYPERGLRRRLIETPEHYLVPVRSVRVEPHRGDVYNLEVEEEHSYLAGFFAVSNCQNWLTSQTLRDPASMAPVEEVGAAEIVTAAKRGGARVVTSTYNEPLITSEWAAAVFRRAKAEGLLCSYVSNGNASEEVLEYLRPLVSLYKVDLKGFRDRPYRELGGTLERVLWTIRALHDRKIWVEVVTLVVPGHNDSPEELRDIARFLVSVSPDLPWHVTAFHSDYKMEDREPTSVRALLRAAEIGAAEGLSFVYAGNLPGAVRSWENTYCPGCRGLLVERLGYRVLKNRLGADGRCPDCQRVVPGVWA
jgi:pyruvate formate lyase activating enzyme